MVFQFLTVFIEFFLCYLLVILKKAMSECANSDVDNGGAEPKAAGVGIFRPSRRLDRATVVHIGISRSFFLQCT